MDEFHFIKILLKKKRKSKGWSVEKKLIETHKNLIAIDEAGRGALAGPLTLGALFLDKTALKILEKNNLAFFDSKELKPKQRIYFRKIIKKLNLPYKILHLDHQKIEKIGLNNAFVWGIQKIITYFQPNCLVIDGLKLKNFETKIKTYFFVKGDKKLPSLGGASILAKTSRDQYMIKISKKFPQYQFERHKGYGTKNHLKLIKKFGPCEIHRKSFLKFLIK